MYSIAMDLTQDLGMLVSPRKEHLLNMSLVMLMRTEIWEGNS